MEVVLIAILGVASALVGGGVWAYLSSRRTSSGTVETSTAAELNQARNDYEKRVDKALEKVDGQLDQLEKQYQAERMRGDNEARLRIDCERRITFLEGESTSRTMIEAAKVEAAKLREEAEVEAAKILADAAAARDLLAEAAAKAKVELKDV